MEILISILGALAAITVAVIGAVFSNRNNNALQIRKLKEEHYIAYIEALHNLMSDNKGRKLIEEYVLFRDKLFIVGSEEVVNSILDYEKNAVGKENSLHDVFLSNIVRAIRKDLKIKDKNFPDVFFKK